MKMKSFSNMTCLISKHNYSVSRTSKLAVFLLILTSDVLLNKSEASEQEFDKLSIADVRTSSASEPTSKHLIYSSAKQPSLQLKHSTGKRKRYRRNPKPVAEVFGTNSLNSGSSFGVAEDQVENSHKPKFESCDEYRPSVREESARGTQVLQVYAKDDDGDTVPSGKVTYSIVVDEHEISRAKKHNPLYLNI